MLIHARLSDTAARVPEKLALRAGDEALTFAALDARTNQAARALRALGLRRGDRVVLGLGSSIDFAVAHWAVLKAGGISVPVQPGTARANLEHILRSCAPVLAVGELDGLDAPRLLAPDALAAAARREAPEPIDAGTIDLDTAVLIHTSGSTGRPKGVMLSHLNLDSAAENIIRFVGMRERDVELSVLPLAHTFGLAHLHAHARTGGTVILDGGLRDPERLLDRLESDGVTSFPGTPAMFGMLLDGYGAQLARRGRGLRTIVVNTAALPAERATQLMALLPETELFVYYGLTEASRATFLRCRAHPDRLGSVGRATPNVEVRVITEDGAAAAPGEEGQVVVRGANVMQGYWGDPEASRAALTPDGLATGDLGFLDGDGFLHLTGRLKDLINVGGQKVSPVEVERVVRSVPGVRDVAAVAGAHPLLGEVVEVHVVREPGALVDAPRIAATCRAALEGYKVPREIRFCDEIPRTASGKMRRFALRRPD